MLATKLHIPPPRISIVQRARLLAHLNEGRQRKLTLISAPAGFGKTTLVSAWVAQCECPVGWVSLDERDGDLASFLTYLVAALQQIQPHFGGDVSGALQSSPSPPGDILLTGLLNEINRIPQAFIIVLDDYHRLNSPSVDAALTFLLDHLPPQMHLVITTREDPQLPLARMRVRDQLTEVRAADLRFNPDEAAEFLSNAMKLQLESADVEALHSRTEGWIAGLQLAALAAQQRTDARDFIRSFSGGHRFVLDYLVEEVLQQQPEHIQQFLLFTSILERMCGSLCDAVLSDATLSGQAALEYCERANLLLVPLDDERQWYRYHHLFADVLQARLLKTQPELISVLHQRASAWYETQGFASDALHHAFAAQDFERAAALVERTWPAIRRTRQEGTFLRWVKALPDALMRQRPVLSVVCAWALMDAGEYEAAEARLRDAEQLLDAPPDQRMIIDAEQFRSLPASIANARAYLAQALNDIPSTVAYTRLALDLLPADDHYERGTTAALLGLACWTGGDLESAYQYFAQGLDDLQRGGGILIRMGGTIVLAHIRAAQGRLHEAANLYQQSLQLSIAHGEPLLKGTAEMYLGLSEIVLEQGKLDNAKTHFATGMDLRERASLPGYEYLWCMVEARIKQAEGALSRALELLDEAERRYYRSPIPNVRPIAALRARMLINADRLPEAQAWARERGLFIQDELSYLYEYEHLTLVRVLLARARLEDDKQALTDAMVFLTRLLQAAEAGGRTGSVSEILMLQADTQALTAAIEGRPARPTVNKSLSEALSERELDVLRLLATELSGPEIADALGVALSTIRSHTKSIYGKLNANSRRSAVNRAEALKLI
ncbi:MAG: LuxR C-terminal-related transcriptional regulator [Chloroflexota bacterium]|nr:LuxR C-terminal-related transcriptional regulator [Chloroflexota bacterium]